MNSLASGLLGLLSCGSCSGYELMLKVNLFWPAKHSQIYPLLADLERDGYVSFTLVNQTGKPDKKVYDLTSRGSEAVSQWMRSPTVDPVTRDEIVLKAYCLGVVGRSVATDLVLEWEAKNRSVLRETEERVKRLKEECGGSLPSAESPAFGRYILLHRRIGKARYDIRWCQWVRTLIDSDTVTNLFDLTVPHDLFPEE